MGEIKDREACTADFALQRNLVTLNVTLFCFFGFFLQCYQKVC